MYRYRTKHTLDIFCFCLLQPLFVILPLPPEVVLHTNSSVVVLTVNLFSYERKYFSTPLGSTIAFVRPRLTYNTLVMAITGMREATGVCQPAAAKPLLFLVKVG